MADVLTRSERESLLAALDSSPSAGMQRSREMPGEIRRSGSSRPEWDRALHAIHTAFAHDLTARCTDLVRTPVVVRLAKIHRLTYGEFILGLEIPACLNLLKIEPLAGHALLQWSPAIVSRLVDRLLGGSVSTEVAAPTRPLTEIELRLLARITDLALSSLREAWRDVCVLEPRMKLMETHPHLLPFGAHETAILEIAFDVEVGDAQGRLGLCLPEEAIESLAKKLLVAGEASSATSLPEIGPPTVRSLGDDMVEMVVHLASTRLTADEIAGLEVGDVIVTDCPPDHPLEVRLDGAICFTGNAGHFQGHKGVRILARRPVAGESNSADSRPAQEDHPAGAP
jgi:flagellar motor switch protein FliM